MHRRGRPAGDGDRGFTLVELLIVIVVLGILAGIVAFGVAGFRSNADASACRADVVVVNSAADAQAAATGTYPGSMADLVARGYLKTPPATGSYGFDQAARTAVRTPPCAGAVSPPASPSTVPPSKAVAMTAADWKVVHGQATLSGATVDASNPVGARVLSVRPFTALDVTLSTTATLRTGQGGYGIWVRASVEGAAVTGYGFQYDVGYGNAYVLRHWYQGAECNVPLAVAKMAETLAIYEPHAVVVVVEGDALLATVDGDRVLVVPSLKAMIDRSTCKFPAATGTGVGFRTFGSKVSAVFVDTTVS